MINGLFTTVTNVNFDDEAIQQQIKIIQEEKAKLVPQCGSCDSACPRNDAYDMKQLWEDNEDIRSLKSLLLFGRRGMAAYALHAHNLEKTDEAVNEFFYKGMFALGENKNADELLSLIMELGSVNLKCMELLDNANTSVYL